MRINADFSRPVTIDTDAVPWIDSPMAGVQRKMLDRIGAESGHATSIVRYAPDSYFSPHTHTGGEEYLVLEGTFSDEHGDYNAGTYVRNPIGTKHTPFSKAGCIIFVKLFQFDSQDNHQFQIDTGSTTQTRQLLLHKFNSEQIYLVTLEPASQFELGPNGFELLILSGGLVIDAQALGKGCWARYPTDTCLTVSTTHGVQFYLKTGHL